MDTVKCIQDDIWEQYSKGQLMPVVLAKIEKHCLNCEICADIKEGIDAMENPSSLAEQVETLIAKTNTNPSKPIQDNRYWYASAAALFLVAVSLSWYFFKDSKEGLVIQNIPEKISIDTVTLSENKVFVKQDSSKSEVNDNLVIHSKTQTPKEIVDDILIEDDFKSLNSDEELKLIKDTIEIASNYKVKSIPNIKTESIVNIDSDSRPDDEIEVTRKKDITTKKITSQSLSTIPFNVNNSSPEILNLPDNYIKTSTQLDSVNYSKASNYYQLNVYDSSLLKLEPIIGKGYGDFYEDAMLLKAQIFVNQGKSNDAIPLLEKLIYLNGKKAKLAKIRLQQIQSAPAKE